MDVGAWQVASVVAAGFVAWAAQAVAARSNRLSKHYEMTSAPYEALAKRVASLEQSDAARAERISELENEVADLKTENRRLADVILSDQRRERGLEETVGALRALIRDLLDGVRQVITDFGDQPAARGRLVHLLEMHEPTISKLSIYSLEPDV